MSALIRRADARAVPLLERAGEATVPVSRPTVPGTITLGELLARAGEAIRRGLPEPLWVLATVAAAKAVRGGHMLELVEAEAGRADGGTLRAYLPDATLAPLAAGVGRSIAAAELVGMTIVLQLACTFAPKWGLGARVLALAPGIEVSIAQRALEGAIARLGAEGLLDRQQKLPAPADVTLVAVVHPPAAAGWADIAGELRRWEAAGILAVRSIPTAFEGPSAAAGLVAALASAIASVDGRRPDVGLVIRGGGSRNGLLALDSEAFARAVALAPVPVVSGTGHQTDRSLADRVSWQSCDTPSKALALLRELVAAPARRAIRDHRDIRDAASVGEERAGATLDALKRRASSAALHQAMAAAQDLGQRWSGVSEAAAAARERCGRLADGLERLTGDVVMAVPAQLDDATTRLAALSSAIRATARSAGEAATDGAHLLAGIEARAGGQREAAASDLTRLALELDASPPRQVDQASADLAVLAEAIRARARDGCAAADDGARHLASVEARVVALVEAQRMQVEHQLDRLRTALPGRFDGLGAALDRALAVLDAHDPGAVLARGFALALDAQGRAITSTAAARGAGPFKLQFRDGPVTVVPIPSTLSTSEIP